MDLTLIGKAKARRVLALSGLTSRRIHRDDVAAFKFLPSLDSDEIGALFAVRRSQFENIFAV